MTRIPNDPPDWRRHGSLKSPRPTQRACTLCVRSGRLAGGGRRTGDPPASRLSVVADMPVAPNRSKAVQTWPMEPVTWVAASWASGLNAYLTVLIIGTTGRLGWIDAPPTVERTWVLVAAAVMFAVEFVADKVPLVDSIWDLAHLLVRPLIGGWLGVAFASAELGRVPAFAAAAGMTLVGHLTKSSTRLAINLSPEPITNVIASVTEDGIVGALVALALAHPRTAAVVAVVLAVLGVLLVVVLWRFVRRGWRLLRRWWTASDRSAVRRVPV